MIDEVRIYNTALTATQIQADQTTPVNSTLPVGTRDLERQRGQPHRGRPLLGRGDRRRDRLPGRALHRRGLLELRPDRDELDHHASRTPPSLRTTPTATASAPPTPPATSAPTPTRRRPPRRSRCPRTTPCSRSRERSSTRLRGPGAEASPGSSTASPAEAAAQGRSRPAVSTRRRAASARTPSRRRPGSRRRAPRSTSSNYARHVHVPQRQHARRREPQRDRADAFERQLDDVREALQLPARRAHARITAVRART